jgi:hypothetical protein
MKSPSEADNMRPLLVGIITASDQEILDGIKSNKMKQIVKLVLENNEEALAQYLTSFKMSIQSYLQDRSVHTGLSVGGILAKYEKAMSDPSIQMIIKLGGSVGDLAKGYAAGGHKELAEACVIKGINGKTATVNDVAFGYALARRTEAAEACVIDGISGTTATVKDVALGYAAGGHSLLTEACFTIGINGKKITANNVSAAYRNTGYLEYAKAFEKKIAPPAATSTSSGTTSFTSSSSIDSMGAYQQFTPAAQYTHNSLMDRVCALSRELSAKELELQRAERTIAALQLANQHLAFALAAKPGNQAFSSSIDASTETLNHPSLLGSISVQANIGSDPKRAKGNNGAVVNKDTTSFQEIEERRRKIPAGSLLLP